MDGGAVGVESVPLVRKVRMTLAGEASRPLERRPAAVRRDISGLVSRLEGLRRSFPGKPDLLDRVGLSQHVFRLLDEARGGLLRGEDLR